jgi:hypothetical protein
MIAKMKAVEIQVLMFPRINIEPIPAATGGIMADMDKHHYPGNRITGIDR